MAAARALVIFGAQGTGKGTQAKALKDRLGVEHIELGSILRDVASERTSLGKQVHEIIHERGELVPDEMSTEIVSQRLSAVPGDQGFVLDGFPRNTIQAENLKDILVKTERMDPKPVFIYLKVPREESVKRLLKRAQDEHRHDDTVELIERRLEIYDERTKPVLEAVSSWADVLEIDGDQPIEKVTEDILKGLGDGS